MSFDYSSRVKLGIILIIFVIISSNVRMLVSTATSDLTFIGNDGISLYEKRFEDLRNFLPPHGAVGYIDDCEGSLGLRNIVYRLTQYILSPIVLINAKFSSSFYSQEILSQQSKLFIVNLLDPSHEPYLTSLLQEGRCAISNFDDSVTSHKISTSGNFILLKDFGNGIRLYSTEIK